MSGTHLVVTLYPVVRLQGESERLVWSLRYLQRELLDGNRTVDHIQPP